MAAKGAREKIRLVSTAETGHFYTTDKNKRNMPEKMEIRVLDHLIVGKTDCYSFAENFLL